MATLTFLNLPAHGHINPTLPVVAELVRRGERVLYYATEPFRAAIEQTGATFRDYGAGYAFDPTQALGGPFGLMARSIESAELMLPALLADAERDQPDFLLLDSMCVWGNLLQQRLRVPAITSCSTFAFNNKVFQGMRQMGGPQQPVGVFLGGLPRFLRYLQVARRVDKRWGTRSPGMGGFFINRQALNLVFTSREFQPQAESFDASYRFVGPSIAERHETSDFPFGALGSGPLIYISMGTVFNALPDFYRHCFEAFAGSPYQVVLSLGKNTAPESLGTPPPNVLVRSYVPQLEILERASLFITHGGMNSVNEALLAHVPMIVIPQAGDQYMVAGRVAQLGAGIALAPREATPARLRALTEQILATPSFKQQGRTLADTLRAAGGYQRAADEILTFMAGDGG